MTEPVFALPKDRFHDSTLVRVTVDWEAALGRITFDCWENRLVSIVAYGMTICSVERRQPWGPSVSVNDVYGPDTTPTGELSLRIEMQSGDIVQLIAKRFEIEDK